MATCPILVIGGGPAGIMASLRASEIRPSSVCLLEKNASLGVKLSITGKGRCNLTNSASIEDFCERFGKNGVFLRNVFSRFFSPELMQYFQSRGLDLKTERQGRVFPVSDSSRSIMSVLETSLKTLSVKVYKGQPVKKIKRLADGYQVACEDGTVFTVQKLIVATGGSSFPQTGSTGEGFAFARELGHAVTPLSAGLVPLESRSFVRKLPGLVLKNIRITFTSGSQELQTPVGELLMTHFGISGPLVLDNSAQVAAWLVKGPVRVCVDLKPGLTEDMLDGKFRKELPLNGSMKLGNYLKTLLPQRLIEVVLEQASLDGDKKCHQVTQKERTGLVRLLKCLTFSVDKTRPLKEAMVTCGGVSLKEINPKTMESKISPGLYFCGEILDLAASSGGYNLQAAFSTGFAAGEAAALSLDSGEQE